MKNSSLAALCIGLAASGIAHADEPASRVAIQRVVASIQADVASQYDCFGDDDAHRYQAPVAPTVANTGAAASLALAAKQNRQRLARIERELRSTPPAR